MRRSLAILGVCFLSTMGFCAFAQDNTAIVDLFSGQSLRGAIVEPSLTIKTRWGDLQVTTDSIVSLACQQPPRILQTLTTQNGDELVGRVSAASIHLLADGKTIELPLDQISRISEPSHPPPATQPTPAILTGLFGDRLAVTPPPAIGFRTRWGLLAFRPEQVRQIVFCSSGQTAHRISLSDGSSLSGVMAADTISVQPRWLGGAALSAPVGEIARLTLSQTDPSAPGPKLSLIGGDVLRGSLAGTITLQTDSGDIGIAAGDVMKLTAASDGSGDWTLTASDGRTITGAPRDATAVCQLDCGVSVTVPAATITEFDKTAPPTPDDPSADAAAAPAQQAVDDTIANLVAQLGGTVPALRFTAQQQLIGMGPAAIDPLMRLRDSQRPVIRARINNVLAHIQANVNANQ
jgi:hypothetical protein